MKLKKLANLLRTNANQVVFRTTKATPNTTFKPNKN